MSGLESFQELAERSQEEPDDGTYPGSKQVRRSVQERENEPVDTSDDEDPLAAEEPRIMEVAGKEREFFSIGALARALNREVQTIRLWERRGHLPKATYRAPGRKKDRLYTRIQIVGLVKLATEEGLMDPTKKKRIDQTRFSERAHNLFAALKKAGK